MTPLNIIEELNVIEQDALALHAQLSDKNRTIPAGQVRESSTTHIINGVDTVDRKIQFLYVSNKIPGGWKKFDDYKKNIRTYKGMDELDRDIEKVSQIQFWIPQSRAFVELISDLSERNEKPETLTHSSASSLFIKYTNSGSNIDNLKCTLLNKVIESNEARAVNLKGSIMNNVTVNGNVNGQFNVAGESISSPVYQLSLAELSSKIEAADAPPIEKASAKSKLHEFLNHPVVAAIVGGLAGNIGK
jgi:hypothetical protein